MQGRCLVTALCLCKSASSHADVLCPSRSCDIITLLTQRPISWYCHEWELFDHAHRVHYTTCHNATKSSHAAYANAGMQSVVDALAILTTAMCEATLDSRSETKAASVINAYDLQRFLEAANIQVLGLEGDVSFDDLTTKKPEATGFAW